MVRFLQIGDQPGEAKWRQPQALYLTRGMPELQPEYNSKLSVREGKENSHAIR